MTIEHTEIRIDWMEGVSVKTSEQRPGAHVVLDRVAPEITGPDHPIYKAFRVDGPDDILLGLSDNTGRGLTFPRPLRREQINAARLSHRESYEAGAPQRTIDIVHIYSWKPTTSSRARQG